MQEEWRDVPGYEGRYRVSNLGRIKTLNYRARKGVESIMIPHEIKGGYQLVRLYGHDGSRDMVGVHRIVMLAFVGPSELHVNHKDWNPRNNNLGNLEYCTPAENNAHARTKPGWKNQVDGVSSKIGRTWKLKPKNGRLIHFAKLVDTQVREIKALLRTGQSKRHIADKFNVSDRCIRAIANGENWAWIE